MLSFLLHNFLDVEELSHATWMFNFIRNCQTLLQSYCSLLHAQQCMRVSGPLYQHLWPLVFLFLGILIRSSILWFYFSFPNENDIGYPFMDFIFPIHMSLVKCFPNIFLIFYWVLYILYIEFWRYSVYPGFKNFIRWIITKYFLPIWAFFFSFASKNISKKRNF